MRVIHLAACLFIAVAGYGCGAVTQPGNVVPPNELIEAGATVETMLQGRTFQLTTLRAKIRDVETHSLEIIGDGMTVSFMAQATPHVPTVTGSTIQFGGHTFEVTATPNSYIVDGQAYQLPSGSIYRFHEGKFLGEFRFR